MTTSSCAERWYFFCWIHDCRSLHKIGIPLGKIMYAPDVCFTAVSEYDILIQDSSTHYNKVLTFQPRHKIIKPGHKETKKAPFLFFFFFCRNYKFHQIISIKYQCQQWCSKYQCQQWYVNTFMNKSILIKYSFGRPRVHPPWMSMTPGGVLQSPPDCMSRHCTG